MGSCVQCPCLSLQGSRDAGLTKSSAGAGAKLGQIGSDFQPLRKTLSAKNLNGVHGQTQYCMGISSYSMWIIRCATSNLQVKFTSCGCGLALKGHAQSFTYKGCVSTAYTNPTLLGRKTVDTQSEARGTHIFKKQWLHTCLLRETRRANTGTVYDIYIYIIEYLYIYIIYYIIVWNMCRYICIYIYIWHNLRKLYAKNVARHFWSYFPWQGRTCSWSVIPATCARKYPAYTATFSATRVGRCNYSAH